MACNSYQTYHSKKSCGCGCEPGWSPWNRDRIYFPDFVANACCNPCCESGHGAASEGCSICNGGGFGSCGSGCGSNCGSGCSCGHHPWPGCGHNGWYGCCGWCPCGCQDWWGCQGGICPRR